MRIAIVSTYPPGAGSLNEYAFHFVRFLREKPEVDEIVILADELPDGQHYPADEAPQGVAPITVVPSWRFGAWNNATRIASAVRAIKPDVVLFNIQFASFSGGKASAALGLTAPALVKAAGFPTIVLLHNIMETVDLKSAGFGGNVLLERLIRMFGTIMTRLLLAADLVALTIPKYVEILEAKYHATNVLLAPHGAFEQAPPLSFEPPPGPLQIMTFGKFGTYKKVEMLIDAFRLLIATRPPAALELVIAGTDSPNAAGYLEGIRRQNADLPGLRFTGYVAEEDVPRVFGDAGVVVFPYTSTTGSSGVLHQAGNYGRAVVLPRLGDLAELIAEEGYTGEFFAPEDTQSLAAALAHVVDDPARRREIGMQNYLAACGLPMAEVVDWYLLHAQTLLARREPLGARPLAVRGKPPVA
jgi:glycosyltransferase involved in cell wall biosynthesis